MNWKYSDEVLLTSARRFTTIAEWRKATRRHYAQALRRGLLPKIRLFLVSGIGGPSTAYSEAELAADAKKYRTRLEWAAAGKLEMAAGLVSHYHCALGYGQDFFRKHCAHMAQRHAWTDEGIILVARQYNHKGDWKRSKNRDHAAAYQAALARRSVFKKATAHMAPKAHPYSGSYVVYSYEFSDKHVYVGLTFLPRTRRSQHMQRGPVFEHLKICPTYTSCTLESGITDPKQAGKIEQHWIDTYEEAGWVLLNKQDGGGVGSVTVTKWTREAIIAEAKKYATRQEWIDKSQRSYRIAKREGWFDEASAHMPKYDTKHLIGHRVSDDTRSKQRAAKLGKKQSQAHRDARSEAVRAWWSIRRTDQTAVKIESAEPKKRGPYKTCVSVLAPEERHKRRLETYSRSYQKRRDDILEQLQKQRDDARRRQLGLHPADPLPNRITHLTGKSEEELLLRKQARERINYGLRKAKASGNVAEIERLQAERKLLDDPTPRPSTPSHTAPPANRADLAKLPNKQASP